MCRSSPGGQGWGLGVMDSQALLGEDGGCQVKGLSRSGCGEVLPIALAEHPGSSRCCGSHRGLRSKEMLCSQHC